MVGGRLSECESSLARRNQSGLGAELSIRSTYRYNVPAVGTFESRGGSLHGSGRGVWFIVNHCGGIYTRMVDSGEKQQR